MHRTPGMPGQRRLLLLQFRWGWVRGLLASLQPKQPLTGLPSSLSDECREDVGDQGLRHQGDLLKGRRCSRQSQHHGGHQMLPGRLLQQRQQQQGHPAAAAGGAAPLSAGLLLGAARRCVAYLRRATHGSRLCLSRHPLLSAQTRPTNTQFGVPAVWFCLFTA